MKIILLLLALCLSGGVPVYAEQTITQGDYTVHYMAFSSATLTPAIARQYGISRGGNQGVITLAIRQQHDGSDVPSKAAISGTVRNLIGQVTSLQFREFAENNAVYYLAVFRFDDKEHMRFELNITPENSVAIPLTYMEQMFVP